jgi:hypothetical protein
MPTLQQLIPEVDIVLALSPEELAPYVLDVAKSQLQNGRIHRTNLTLVTSGTGIGAHRHSPWGDHEHEVDLAVREAWQCLLHQGLAVPASGSNGANGFCEISRRGNAIKSTDDYKRFAQAAAFPKSMLHSSIADKVWLDLVRGDLADAVFGAFRAVEEAVRAAGGYDASDIGIDLMRKAFDPKTGGPLADMKQEKGERDSLAHRVL